MNLESIQTWHFDIDNDNLIELVLNGKKTATTHIKTNENIPQIGELRILIYDNEKKACIIKTTNVIVTKFKNISEDLAKLEGEGDKSLDYYRKTHIDYFKTIDKTFNDETLIIFEIFQVVENLIKTRLEMANNIVKNNEDIFGKNRHHVVEINAGFNNDIFNVDDKYIIKVCANITKECEFNVEANFYKENSNYKYIPKLYRYDYTKNAVPFVYEIIEKVPGKSLYYYWYKMSEKQREITIKNLVNVLKNIHKEKKVKFDWLSDFKNDLIKYYEIVKSRFNIQEQILISNTINSIDKFFQNNKIVLIHNDLHFDNIIKNEKSLFLIDFNDAKYAPFDYDLRLLFMYKDAPWKWANIEMDPFQKPEDYKNIVVYLKKYYNELNSVDYIMERMTIYKLENDLNLFTRFNTKELRDNIISYCKNI